MWKIYGIIAIWIQLSNGLCNSRMPCVFTTTPTLPSYSSTNVTDSKVTQSRYDINNISPVNILQYGQNIQNNNNVFSQQSTIDYGAPLPPAPPRRGQSPQKSFNSKLFEIMSLTAHQQNLVYSPISLQTLLSFILTISEGKLSDELRQLLVVPNNSNVAATFQSIINKASFNTPPTTLIMANKFYYDYRFGIVNPNIRNLALNSFASELEQIDFQTPPNAANIINSWVSEKTRNLIRDIVTPSAIATDTTAVLLNTIYFKSEWLNKFSTYDTQIQQFHATRSRQVPVNMMFNEDVFRYGDFSHDLQASIVELPYKTSDLTMMLILPKDVEGLRALESKLPNYNLELLSQQLKNELVTVKLPKFKVEFDIDMVTPLRQLGLNALFNKEGKINLFENQQKPLIVDQVKHKSFIDVNEAGTEAAAATFAKYVPLSIPVNMKYFIADHPFIFVIRNPSTIFFIGHIVDF